MIPLLKKTTELRNMVIINIKFDFHEGNKY